MKNWALNNLPDQKDNGEEKAAAGFQETGNPGREHYREGHYIAKSSDLIGQIDAYKTEMGTFWQSGRTAFPHQCRGYAGGGAVQQA